MSASSINPAKGVELRYLPQEIFQNFCILDKEHPVQRRSVCSTLTVHALVSFFCARNGGRTILNEVRRIMLNGGIGGLKEERKPLEFAIRSVCVLSFFF